MLRKAALILGAALIAQGCATAPAPVDPPDSQPAAPVVQIQPPPQQPTTAPVLVDLTLYQFLVPAPVISQSKDFWKPVRESVVDAATQQMLNENGVRVGLASVDDWPKFKEVFDKASAHGTYGHYVAAETENQEIPVSGEMPEQWLFYWDRHGLTGTVYDHCRDLLSLGFAPTPGGGGSVRVELCPMVRTTRRHYSYTVLNGETSVDYAGDEHLYDMNLRVDVPPGEFLIVAPSPQSQRTTSIGHQFLTQDANSGRRELVLVFVGYCGPAKPVYFPGSAVR